VIAAPAGFSARRPPESVDGSPAGPARRGAAWQRIRPDWPSR
jgi:hypothetical protein